jgi:hypothetical protein
MKFDLDISAADPTKLLEPLPERRSSQLSFGIAFRVQNQHTYAAHPSGLLCARSERPRRRCCGNSGNEIASTHRLACAQDHTRAFNCQAIKTGKDVERNWWPVRQMCAAQCRRSVGPLRVLVVRKRAGRVSTDGDLGELGSLPVVKIKRRAIMPLIAASRYS